MTDNIPEQEALHHGDAESPPRTRAVSEPSEASDRRLDLLIAAARTTLMPMVVSDPRLPDNPILFCNAAFERMTGYLQAEILGRNCRFMQGPETDRGVVRQVRDAVARHEEVAVEILNYRKNGSTFWNALFVSPVFDAAGNPIYFFASQLDISRRKEAEEALLQAQKMEAVGKLTGGIAHDFNNLLQVVIGYVDLLESRIDAGDRAARHAVEAIGTAAGRGAKLTQQLLAFARKQELRDRLLNPNTLILDLRPIIGRGLADGVTVQTIFDDDSWNCRIDPVQAEMALLNVIANAGEAMPGGGEITIRTANLASSAEAPLATGLVAGDYVAIHVDDRGPGVDPGVTDRIFEPFFSTKDVGQGTGLGLSMVYGFMRQSGGGIATENLAGGGARFTLFFPRSSGAVEPRHDRAGSEPPHRERILMVEDQPEVAELGKAILQNLGYDVRHVSNGQEALDLLQADPNFGLLFTDIAMPGEINGVALAQRVRAIFPDMAILLTTGYSDRALDSESRAFDLVPKPYRRADLASRVRMLLEGSSALN